MTLHLSRHIANAKGYRPRPLNRFEQEIVADWCDNPRAVFDEAETWVHQCILDSGAARMNFAPHEIDGMIEKTHAFVEDCYGRGISAFAVPDELRTFLRSLGLTVA